MKGYHAIVPDLTAAEEATILGFLKEAREQAVDFKNIKEISAIFEIYKTKSEQYLISNGRNWKALYKGLRRRYQAQKAAATTARSRTERRAPPRQAPAPRIPGKFVIGQKVKCRAHESAFLRALVGLINLDSPPVSVLTPDTCRLAPDTLRLM